LKLLDFAGPYGQRKFPVVSYSRFQVCFCHGFGTLLQHYRDKFHSQEKGWAAALSDIRQEEFE